MKKIATNVFIAASILFGIFGLCIVLTAGGPDTPDSALSQMFIRLLFATVFIILPSFALAVASKYLK
jgi:multisubunit Na+/H+ antiporter MnhB subunit